MKTVEFITLLEDLVNLEGLVTTKHQLRDVMKAVEKFKAQMTNGLIDEVRGEDTASWRLADLEAFELIIHRLLAKLPFNQSIMIGPFIRLVLEEQVSSEDPPLTQQKLPTLDNFHFTDQAQGEAVRAKCPECGKLYESPLDFNPTADTINCVQCCIIFNVEDNAIDPWED